MVERTIDLLNAAYYSLSNETRRDILFRVSKKELSIKELATDYEMSFAAVAKHVAVLEAAHLIEKQRSGKLQIIQANPKTIKMVAKNLSKFEQLWTNRFKALDKLLTK